MVQVYVYILKADFGVTKSVGQSFFGIHFQYELIVN